MKYNIIITIKKPKNIKYSSNFPRFHTNSYNVIINCNDKSHEQNLDGLIF